MQEAYEKQMKATQVQLSEAHQALVAENNALREKNEQLRAEADRISYSNVVSSGKVQLKTDTIEKRLAELKQNSEILEKSILDQTTKYNSLRTLFQQDSLTINMENLRQTPPLWFAQFEQRLIAIEKRTGAPPPPPPPDRATPEKPHPPEPKTGFSRLLPTFSSSTPKSSASRD